jgi:MATE family multidrug resistance protein
MYGHFGVPAFGAVGCGMASAITMWLIMIVLGSILYFHPIYAPLKIFERVSPLRVPILKEIVKLGMPIGITITAEAGLFSLVSILVGTRGAAITAAHQIAINFASTLFMIPLAFSSAITVRTGHAIGAGYPAEVPQLFCFYSGTRWSTCTRAMRRCRQLQSACC